MILHIKVRPGSKTDSIKMDGACKFVVKIRQQPVDGKANKYLRSYLANILALPASAIKIVKGENSPHKKIEILAEEEYVLNTLKKIEP